MKTDEVSAILHGPRATSAVGPLALGRDLDERIWRFLFWALLLLSCAPFWIFRYYPSQDGPSHLNNASVLAHYGAEAIYRQYYVLNLFPPAGNILTHFLLATFLQFSSPLVAEKLLLTLYVTALFLSLRYFLNSVTPYANYFAILAAVLAPNSFLYMGFWNFCLSIPLVLLVLGYYKRRQRSWTPGSLLLLMGSGCIVYLTHAISWAICVLAVVILGWQEFQWPAISDRLERSRESLRAAVLRYVLPVMALLPPGILLLLHMLHTREQSMCIADPSIRKRMWFLYSLSFLQTLVTADRFILVKVLAVALFATAVLVLALVLWQRQYVRSSSALLGVSLACGLLTLFGPECMGSGSYIRVRMAFYAWLFFVTWLASVVVSWPRKWLNFVAGAFFSIAVVGFVTSWPVLSKWNKTLSEIAATGRYVRPASTVFLVNLQTPLEGPENPYLHATGLLSTQAVIDLSNYEATSEFFLTRFRPERSPFPALGTLQELAASPPVFDISRYERETQGRVDYVLFLLDRDRGSNGTIDTLVHTLYRDQIASYAVVPEASGENQTIRLYQHKLLREN